MLYLVTMMRNPAFDPAVIPEHQAFLEQLKASGELIMWGPFTDRTGGAYVLQAGSLDEAASMAFTDPVHVSGASTVTVTEWDAKHP